MSATLDRRTFMAAGIALGSAGPALARDEIMIVTDDRPLTVGTRSTRMLITRREGKPKGVVLFSTGHGSWPERYQRLATVLAIEGFAVLAPVHVDSMHYPDRAKFTMQQGFVERLADMRAAADVASSVYPKLPVVAAGHSFGSLIALCEAGALANIGAFRQPAVEAVLAFSTPGKIPGLVQPDAYTSVAVPLMVVTGSADTIPAAMGYPNAPADHLLPAETARAGSYGLSLDGADHALVDDAARLPRALEPVRLFLRGYGLDDKRARGALDGWRAPAGDQWTIRKASA
jgi:dienelactone hydrolase